MKKVLLLGASGSIGTQTIDVISKNTDQFVLTAFSVGSRSESIPEIIKSNPKDFLQVSFIDKDVHNEKYRW